MFALPALESSAFVGFVFPGEIAVILGGVLAFEHRISLPAAIAAAVSGAVVGDCIGYVIGRLWGRRLLRGTLGRLPLIRHHLDRSLDRAQAYVRRRRGAAVFFGRFTAALRVLVPGLAGISEIHFPTFLLFNAAGGAVWGTGFVLLGYAAGAGYRRVERVAGTAGLILLGVIVTGLILGRVLRRRDRLPAALDRMAAAPPFAWMRRKFPRQVAWLRRRLDPSSPTGFWLTFTVAFGALAAWAFESLTQDVIGHDQAALLDPRLESFILAHRNAALTAAGKALTWLGSSVVLIPLALALGLWLRARRRTWRPAMLLALALGGAVALYDIVKPLVGRARPPMAAWIGHFSGRSFPSGHATQSLAVYGMAALLLSRHRRWEPMVGLWAAAALLVLVIGATRIYLGAHWLTDVLAGYALGAAWLAVLAAAELRIAGPGDRPTAGTLLEGDDGGGSRVEGRVSRDGADGEPDGRPIAGRRP